MQKQDCKENGKTQRMPNCKHILCRAHLEGYKCLHPVYVAEMGWLESTEAKRVYAMLKSLKQIGTRKKTATITT